MNIKTSIDREIRNLIIRMFIIIAFVVISIPLRNELQISKTTAENIALNAAPSNEVDLDVVEQEMLVLSPMSEADALSNKPVLLNLTGKGEYELYFNYSKDSTIKAEWLNININGKTYKLTSLKSKKSNSNIYYIIDSGKLTADKTINAYLWLDANVGNEAQNKNLIFSYEL